MSFTNPLYLWTLLGLLVPIAIHLWSKKEGKTIKIGSIKLLSEEDSRQSSSISLNEILLLCLRVFIVTLLALIMSEPQFERQNKNSAITYLVEPSLVEDPQIKSVIDSLNLNSPMRLLQDGFPELSDDLGDLTNSITPNYWQLAEDMESLHTDSIVVFTKGLASGLKSRRPATQANTEWILVNPETSSENIINAVIKKDEIELLSHLGSLHHIQFKKQIISATSSKIKLNTQRDSLSFMESNTKKQLLLKKESSINILLFYDEAFKGESVYISAAMRAISDYTNHRITTNKRQNLEGEDLSQYSHIIWLSDKPLPSSSARQLVYDLDPFATNLINQSIEKTTYHITKPLNDVTIIDNRLTEHLLSWLELNADLEDDIAHLDRRVVSKNELLPLFKETSKRNDYVETLSMSPWLWILLALVLVTERIVAHLRKQ